MTPKRLLILLPVLPAVLSVSIAQTLDLEQEYRDQHADLAKQMEDRSWCQRVAAQALHPASLIETADRDPADVVIRRTAVLLAHIQGMPSSPDLGDCETALKELRARAGAVAISDVEGRYRLYLEACRLRRKIAFANPLLDFDRLLFLTKHRPWLGDHHMVDQYYGFNAKPGGSLYVLADPWSDAPKATDLMAVAAVQSGRLQGRKLEGGAFNTLELDFDGKTVAFAYSECGPMPESPDWKTNQPPKWDTETGLKNKREYYYWSPERTFNLYRAELAVSKKGEVELAGLRPLVDSHHNEFDPCFLPGGRIAFLSERRGGFLRCGGNRPNPTFTLHSMERDGSDVVTLSFHETQEWNPSVDNDGMIAYTRWDYVDRDNDGAHHIWLCFPDGRDPRAFHGNYPEVRESRPWMEMGIRAVPGSHKYVAVSAAHHGYAYGSLVLIDQTIADDGAMSQVKRLTPETLLPESEMAPGLPHPKGKHDPRAEVYGTPWPLSEEFHLCIHDRRQEHYGIYLIDAFGNRELVWRDPEVACLDPIPLRPRPRPPVIPANTTQHRTDKASGNPETATVAVMNVYESDFHWPPGTRISALRVVQLHEKTSWHLKDPEVGVGSESLVRGLLGEAPVEEDGSAYFEAPAGVPIYFQALDRNGQAVQSMRSLTYLHPGERLTCVGCHESKRQAPPSSASTPLALRRPPSKLSSPFPDANPIHFSQLIQPVLDRNCVACHVETQEEGAPLLGTHPVGKWGWSESYANLAPMLWGLSGGNGIIVENGMRSIPGQVGAEASDLWRLLQEGHYDLALSPEDRKRLVVWLDLNSIFYGTYE